LKAITANNQPNTFVFSWTYELPVGQGKRFLASANPVVNRLAGGWQVNSIETYTSGTPIAVGGGPNIPCLGEATVRTGFPPMSGALCPWAASILPWI
jgi:hypothetical protein